MNASRRRTSVAITMFALVLVLLTQYLTWREHQRSNPALWLFIPLLLGPLWVALRRKDDGDSDHPSA